MFFHQKHYFFIKSHNFSSKNYCFSSFFVKRMWFFVKNTSLGPTLANVSHFWAFRASRLDETLRKAKIASHFFCKSPPGSAIWALATGAHRRAPARSGAP